MLRAGSDKFWSMAIMCLATACVCGIGVVFAPFPAGACWRFVALSAFFHVGYNLFLVRAYRSGDLGQTYPVARGSSPLLVSLGAALFAGERLDLLGAAGVCLICGGITSLAFQGRSFGRQALLYALGTGCFIGCYSVTDGIGVRLAGTPVGYTLWMTLIGSVTTPMIYIALRGPRSLLRATRPTLIAASGGAVSLLAYGIVILAMSRGPMGPVSALRETSVVFAALIGRFFLNERLTPFRLAACVVITIGAICIGNAHTLAHP